jgi:hypothetical protein
LAESPDAIIAACDRVEELAFLTVERGPGLKVAEAGRR